MIMEFEKIWEKVLMEIELNVSKANFITWFKNTSIVKDENGVIFLGVPNTFVKEWLNAKYNKFILKALHNFYPSVRNIKYLINTQSTTATTSIIPKTKIIKQGPVPFLNEEQLEFNELYIDKEANLNPKYTFDSFIVGPFNEIAYAAASAIIKNLGFVYNPLFIYGGVGLGKTHLLQAIGNEVKKQNTSVKIQYSTSEKFASDLVTSIQNNSVCEFKERYKNYNLLIIDDIQFFPGKPKVQEEFFHIFNTLYEKNNQVNFSSDCSPKCIIGIEERIRSRLEGGMMVDISKPEFESRLAILKSKLETKNFTIKYEVLEYIASVIENNIRELEGALNCIIGQSKIRGKILCLDEVKEILKKNIKPLKIINFNDIIKTVTKFYDINEKDIFNKTRKKEIVKPRQVAMYLLREDLMNSYPNIGQKFGHKDHSTIIHAYKKISELLKKNEKFNNEIKQIRNILYR